MKNIVKLSTLVGLITTVYFTSSDLFNRLYDDIQTIANTTLLFQYGGMIGYSLFVIFIMMLQGDTIGKIRSFKPRLSTCVHCTYIAMGVAFILVTLINFTIQIALIMAILFMLMTAILDMIRDKITQEHEGNQLHPKKIL
jgi:ABC-type multidrug transport system fused ATPase/permease subunit